MRRQVSASRIYDLAPTAEQLAAARPKIYEERQYQGLESYQQNQLDPLAQRPGESPQGYRLRLQQHATFLPVEDVEGRQVIEDRIAAITGDATNHNELRGQLDQMQSGEGLGLFGPDTVRRQPEATPGRLMSKLEVAQALRDK
jgi:hypothetical protein